jgi:hypothetical protein
MNNNSEPGSVNDEEYCNLCRLFSVYIGVTIMNMYVDRAHMKITLDIGE